MSSNTTIDHALKWRHGSHARFDEWVIPPPPSPRKPELVQHTAVFLTTDHQLTLGDGAINFCEANLAPEARVIDLIHPNADAEEMRLLVRSGVLGRHHDYAASPEYWRQAWREGEMMRFGTTDTAIRAKLETTQALAMRAKAGDLTPETIKAWLDAQNLIRRWIEELVVAARRLGFDALIRREIDSQRAGGSVACDVLFALTQGALTPPRWLPSP